MTDENKTNKTESSECCLTNSCCGVKKSNVASFLRHIAKFFD
jgi:hypothetical protein